MVKKFYNVLLKPLMVQNEDAWLYRNHSWAGVGGKRKWEKIEISTKVENLNLNNKQRHETVKPDVKLQPSVKHWHIHHPRQHVRKPSYRACLTPLRVFENTTESREWTLWETAQSITNQSQCETWLMRWLLKLILRSPDFWFISSQWTLYEDNPRKNFQLT